MAAPGTPLAPPTPVEKACDVKMFIEELPGSGVEGISLGHLGAIIAEPISATQLTNGICIKRPGWNGWGSLTEQRERGKSERGMTLWG